MALTSTGEAVRASAQAIEIRNVTKRYGEQVALRRVSLNVEPGEFIAILGSSGSGKSTLLMALAGFVQINEGAIILEGRDIAPVPANARGFGVVFQNYALFPHMSVIENVMYPLNLRGVPRRVARLRAADALATVKLAGFEDRRIDALSGGQRQRVALARAIVYEPAILLMDEPLSALDKSLREEMQIEIRELHDKLNITTLYVTHDQREALTMADRIAVMSHGEIVQVDTPERIYREPSSEFVARFLGEAVLFSPATAARLLTGARPASARASDLIMLRSEDLRLEPAPGEACVSLRARVHAIVFQGDSWLLQLDTAEGERFAARAQRMAAARVAALAPGDDIELHVRTADIHCVRADA
ncbi:ABC transporter ATP-binding protein [Ancylobacter pratisalsi]|uniref:ABC transporter ATP-binding protein n=1 Tax=Ancylobacter pratisalsi TaxID=1745854 RepID=A0A6P1YID9_9HYPH|nr:ABC transporter ATP-binding protein [Ancylobacter pratisalsi]QIB33097.1 ABC transporter ATP-binding protein [Ancylobacter pratisalsi]